MIERDEAKRLHNLDRHGLDVLQADLLFDGRPVVEVPSLHALEPRVLTIADLDGVVVTAVWTWRGDRRRIISPRSARREEGRSYRRLQP